MSSTFIILQDKAAPTALCSMCPDPGHCCRKFTLSGDTFPPWFLDDEGFDRAQEEVDKHGFPFRVLSVAERWEDENGRRNVDYFYTCSKVTPEGLCSIYDNRPGLCHRFVPASGNLCVFDKHGFHPPEKEIDGTVW